MPNRELDRSLSIEARLRADRSTLTDAFVPSSGTVVGSESGQQTSSRGKDHHSVTSGMRVLWGSRVEDRLRGIGQTDDRVIMALLEEGLVIAASDHGTIITPAMIITPATIHNELR